jgi:hypothetical protein
LDTVDGIKDAIAELDGVRRALIRRGKAVENGENVEELSVEEAASWDGFSEESSSD